MRLFVAFEPVERMGVDVVAAKGEREDAAECAKDALDRPGRETVRLQLVHKGDDIVGGDQSDGVGEPGQQVAVQLRAVEIECAIAPLTRCDLRLEVGEPASRDLGEGEPG